MVDKIENAAKSLNKYQKMWSVFAIVLVAITADISGANYTVMSASILGIMFVLTVNFKWPMSQILGCVFSSLLAYLSWQQGFIANMSINLVMVPMSIIGYVYWSKNNKSGVVDTRSMSLQQLLHLVFACTLVIVPVYLLNTGSNMPLLDAVTGVLPVVATVLMLLAYKEQWIIWNTVNLVQVYMWGCVALSDSTMSSMFVMKIVFLLNSMYGMYNWYRAEKQ